MWSIATMSSLRWRTLLPIASARRLCRRLKLQHLLQRQMSTSASQQMIDALRRRNVYNTLGYKNSTTCADCLPAFVTFCYCTMATKYFKDFSMRIYDKCRTVWPRLCCAFMWPSAAADKLRDAPCCWRNKVTHKKPRKLRNSHFTNVYTVIVYHL